MHRNMLLLLSLSSNSATEDAVWESLANLLKRRHISGGFIRGRCLEQRSPFAQVTGKKLANRVQWSREDRQEKSSCCINLWHRTVQVCNLDSVFGL